MPYVFDGGNENGLPEYQPPCREVRLSADEVIYVHGYTFADVWDWQMRARLWTQTQPPSQAPQWAQEIAQTVFVCRTAPGTDQRTFVVRDGGEKQVIQHFRTRLPGQWIRMVCSVSDSLSMEGYVEDEDAKPSDDEEARKRLGEMLNDPETWAALNLFSLKMYNIPLRRNKEPIGEVVTALRLDRDRQDALVKAIGPLAALGGMA